jgi:putative cell wall-binding protein
MDLQFERPIRFDSVDEVSEWAWKQLQKIEETLNVGPKIIKLSTSNKEPVKRKDGMVVLADGTNWNPGAGQGYYGYYAGAWHKLG